MLISFKLFFARISHQMKSNQDTHLDWTPKEAWYTFPIWSVEYLCSKTMWRYPSSKHCVPASRNFESPVDKISFSSLQAFPTFCSINLQHDLHMQGTPKDSRLVKSCLIQYFNPVSRKCTSRGLIADSLHLLHTEQTLFFNLVTQRVLFQANNKILALIFCIFAFPIDDHNLNIQNRFPW